MKRQNSLDILPPGGWRRSEREMAREGEGGREGERDESEGEKERERGRENERASKRERERRESSRLEGGGDPVVDEVLEAREDLARDLDGVDADTAREQGGGGKGEPGGGGGGAQGEKTEKRRGKSVARYWHENKNQQTRPTQKATAADLRPSLMSAL